MEHRRRTRGLLVAGMVAALFALAAAGVLATRSFEAHGLDCGTLREPADRAAQAWEDIYELREAYEASGGDPCPPEADRRRILVVALGAGGVAALVAVATTTVAASRGRTPNT